MATCTEKVKNLALVGQGGVGKTMLAEAMLHLTGRTPWWARRHQAHA